MLQEIEGSAQVKDFFLNTSAHLVKVIIQNRQELPSFVNYEVGHKFTFFLIS
jgi:hypothetical protein